MPATFAARKRLDACGLDSMGNDIRGNRACCTEPPAPSVSVNGGA